MESVITARKKMIIAIRSERFTDKVRRDENKAGPGTVLIEWRNSWRNNSCHSCKEDKQMGEQKPTAAEEKIPFSSRRSTSKTGFRRGAARQKPEPVSRRRGAPSIQRAQPEDATGLLKVQAVASQWPLFSHR